MTESYSSFQPSDEDKETAEAANDYLTGKTNLKLSAARWHIDTVLGNPDNSRADDSDFALSILARDAKKVDQKVFDEIYEFRARPNLPSIARQLKSLLEDIPGEAADISSVNPFDGLEPLPWELN